MRRRARLARRSSASRRVARRGVSSRRCALHFAMIIGPSSPQSATTVGVMATTSSFARAAPFARDSRRRRPTLLASSSSRAASTRAASSANASTSSPDAVRARVDVRDAKRECARTTETYAKSFHLASTFMRARAREDAYALYAWCRECDQLVDAAGEASSTPEEAARALDGVERRLNAIFDAASASPPEGATYAEVALWDAARDGEFDSAPFLDMIRGMRRDLEEESFKTYADVETYAYQVAGTVALMILPVLTRGMKKDDEATKMRRDELGVALGVALQLTNIVRDVGEDARLRGRVYIAEEDLELFGLTRDDVLTMDSPTPAYEALIEYQVQRALGYYARAARGLKLLPTSSRPVTNCIAGLYKKIMLSVRDNAYDNLNKRAFASKYEKLFILPSLVVDSLRGVSNDDASRKRDGDLRLDFTDDTITAKRYRATMCALFVAARASDADAVAERLDALRLLAAPSTRPSSSTDVARGEPVLLYASPRPLDPYEDDSIVVRSDGRVLLR